MEQQHVVHRLIRLRQRLKAAASTEQIEDALSQLNVVMHMLLAREVCLDFAGGARREDAVLPKLMQLVLVAQNLGDEALSGDLRGDLQWVLSSCVNCALLGACDAPQPCSAMPTDEKLERMRSSLLRVL
jgi:hypothetical protein